MFKSKKILVEISLFSVVSYIISLFKFPIFPFLPMYKIDFGESLILFLGILRGPFFGILVSFFKEVLSVIFKGTRTFFLSEVVDFFLSSVLTFFCTYKLVNSKKLLKKIIKNAALGIILRTIIACLLNYYFIIPIFCEIFSISISRIVKNVNIFLPFVNDFASFIFFVVAPFNFFKSLVSCIVAILLYLNTHSIFEKLLKFR